MGFNYFHFVCCREVCSCREVWCCHVVVSYGVVILS